VDAEYSYEADTEEYSEEYSEENPENLDAAIAAYGHEVPGVIIPEGCVPVYAYALDGYMSVDYEGEDSYFGVSMYYMDDVNDTATLLLGSDGSFTEPEGIIVNISQDEEGSVYYVDAAIGNTSLSIYSYDGNMRIEDVQAMLAGVI